MKNKEYEFAIYMIVSHCRCMLNGMNAVDVNHYHGTKKYKHKEKQISFITRLEKLSSFIVLSNVRNL